MENHDGELITKVYQKSSYEPYYLPFNSTHPKHMKKNIPYAMLLRAIRYCSTFQAYLDERSKLKIALLPNKYPGKFIDQQCIHMLQNFNIDKPLTTNNYNALRQKVINTPLKEKVPIDYSKIMFVHFTYCLNMTTFPKKFHTLWNKYFEHFPIDDGYSYSWYSQCSKSTTTFGSYSLI